MVKKNIEESRLLLDEGSSPKKYVKWAIDKYGLRRPVTHTIEFELFMKLTQES